MKFWADFEELIWSYITVKSYQKVVHMEYKCNITFDTGWLWRSKSRLLTLSRFIDRTRSVLGHLLLLTTKRKSYIWSPTAVSGLP